jgi:hypothetical protein
MKDCRSAEMIQIYLIAQAWRPASETFASSAMTTPIRQVWSALIRIADEAPLLKVTAHDIEWSSISPCGLRGPHHPEVAIVAQTLCASARQMLALRRLTALISAAPTLMDDGVRPASPVS